MIPRTQNELFTIKKRAFLYARTSSDDTAKDSLTGQLEVCEKYAIDNGYIVIERLQEDVRGVKGDDRNAPALNKALEMAKTGMFDVLIIRDVKRYSRDVYKAMDFERLFYDSGIEIEYVWNRELNGLPRKGIGSMIRFLQYWMSEQDRQDVVKKLYSSKIDAVRRKGSVMTHGKPPYGYREVFITEGRLKRRVLVINEEEAKWVRKIFEWYIYGDETLRGIIARLKEHCVPKPSIANPEAKQGTGKHGPFNWPHTTVREILIRRAYIGEWEYSKDKAEKRQALEKSIIADVLPQGTISVEVPAIVEREPFEAAQTKLKKNQQKTYRNSQYEFLMRGRATCGLCGYACRCVAKKWKTYTYLKYACNPKWSGIPHPETNEVCTLPQMKQDFIDTEVWEWLKQLMNDDMELQKGYQDYLADKETKIEPLRDEMYRIEASLAVCRREAG